MGVCINILSIPILEDKECREERLESKVEKIEAKNPRVLARQESSAYKSYFRNFGTGETPVEGVSDSVAEAATAVAALSNPIAGAVSALGGLFGLSSSTPAGNEEIDLMPVALAAGAALVLVMVLSSGDSRR